MQIGSKNHAELFPKNTRAFSKLFGMKKKIMPIIF